MLLFNHEASEAVGENRRLTTFWRQRKTGNFICASESKLGFTMSSGWITQSYLLFLFLFIHLSWSNLTGSSANAFNVASVSYEGKLPQFLKLPLAKRKTIQKNLLHPTTS
jgi:hypothetical protein